VGLVLALTTGLLLVLSIVPTAGEVVSILIFGAISLLFLVAWFAVALALSTVARESGNALIFTLMVLFAISALLPMIGAAVGDAVAGPPPQLQLPETSAGEIPGAVQEITFTYASNETGSYVLDSSRHEALVEYREELAMYTEKRRTVTDVITLLSPQKSYQIVADLVSTPGEGSLLESLGSVWAGIAGLIVFPSVFFAAAYTRFMRMDIR